MTSPPLALHKIRFRILGGVRTLKSFLQLDILIGCLFTQCEARNSFEQEVSTILIHLIQHPSPPSPPPFSTFSTLSTIESYPPYPPFFPTLSTSSTFLSTLSTILLHLIHHPSPPYPPFLSAAFRASSEWQGPVCRRPLVEPSLKYCLHLSQSFGSRSHWAFHSGIF